MGGASVVLWCCSQKCALSCSQHDLIRFVPLKKCSFFHSFFNTHTLTHTRVRVQNQVRVRAIVLRGGGSCHGRGAAADLHRGLAPEPRGAADALPGRAFGAWQNQPLSERATLKGRVCLMDSSPSGALLSFSRTSRTCCSLSQVLRDLLLQKANEGVEVFVLVYRELSETLQKKHRTVPFFFCPVSTLNERNHRQHVLLGSLYEKLATLREDCTRSRTRSGARARSP